MGSTRTRLGWQALVGVGLCGAVVGFAVPSIAASLIRRERQQPSVRLLPAPRLPESETRPSLPGEATPSTPATLTPSRKLGMSKAERRALSRLRQSGRATAGERFVAPGSTAPPTSTPPSESSAPSQSDSPSKQDTKTSETKPSPVNGKNGGSSAPVTGHSHK
jgi:hypothetical protein